MKELSFFSESCQLLLLNVFEHVTVDLFLKIFRGALGSIWGRMEEEILAMKVEYELFGFGKRDVGMSFWVNFVPLAFDDKRILAV